MVEPDATGGGQRAGPYSHKLDWRPVMWNNLTVLVASADPGIGCLLRRHFDGMRCASIVKATAQDTLDLIRRAPSNLVVASAATPDMNAVGFIKALR